MTEAEWLTSHAPVKMLKAGKKRFCRRKLRLFAVACARRIEHLLIDPESRNAIDMAERFADDDCNVKELQSARTAAEAAHLRAFHRKGKVGACVEWAAEYAADDFGFKAAESVSWMAATTEKTSNAIPAEYRIQAEFMRDIFGNPFRPVSVVPTWLTPAVVSLAQAIYDERAFDRMPELADALAAGSCTNADILEHCRWAGPHVRGCWLVDLILGKE